jgi:UDP-2-acetamido-2,6-beta-L-arabino-hexul-4-ose reductase
MSSLKIGITGQSGFIGTHLYNTLGLSSDRFLRIPFADSFFESAKDLCDFVKQCDVIIHLAAVNRHEDQQVLYDINVALVDKLIKAMENKNVTPHLLFSSSIQEVSDNLYGQSKLKCYQMFEAWAKRNNANLTALAIPNVFGEFARPNYNTFVATFAHKLVSGEQPLIMVNQNVKLIHVGSLCRFIISQFGEQGVKRIEVPYDFECSVSDVLSQFEQFKVLYFEQGLIPLLSDIHEVNLFNTFRSYIPPTCIKLVQHADSRGSFIETLKTKTGGQFSFSTTMAGIIRGNHYHTRKIERFVVIKGNALIQLRKIGTREVFNFELDGKNPAYVDIPVWYTHNIKNIGMDELYTQFWINEWYNPEDHDTYYEEI